MNRFIKSIVSVCFVLFAMAFLYVPASADNVYDYYSLPTPSNYPNTAEGYMDYITDYYKVLAYNVDSAGVNSIMYPIDEAHEYFTDENINWGYMMDPRQAMSQYYIGGGSVYGGSSETYQGKDGHRYSLYLQSYDPSVLSYGLDGNLYYLVEVGVFDEKGNLVRYRRQAWTSPKKDMGLNDAPHLESDGFVRWHYYSSSGSNITGEYYVGDLLETDADGNFLPPQETPNFVTGTVNNIPGHIERNPDGSVVFIGDDGTIYNFNPDGTVTGPDGKNYPFVPNPDDITDELKDYISDWSLLILSALENIKHGTGSDSPFGCKCKDYTSILQYISNNVKRINSNLDKVNSNLSKLIKATEAEGAADFFSNIFGGLLAALGGVIGSLLGIVIGDINDAATKASYYSIISAILIALNNLLPMVAISDVMTTLERFIFDRGSPSDITINIYNYSYTFLDSSFLSEYHTYIDIIKNFVSIVILYNWLRAMRRKVASV